MTARFATDKVVVENNTQAVPAPVPSVPVDPGDKVKQDAHKMKSRFDSVVEQTGIFTGDGCFDITVGKHSQIDRAVITSTATADKNSLNTRTLGSQNPSHGRQYQRGGLTESTGKNCYHHSSVHQKELLWYPE
ncbi:hypothetical protein MA395_002961 [Salmonella enterica]|nr:hypothetical protein [Salmonella enterica]